MKRLNSILSLIIGLIFLSGNLFAEDIKNNSHSNYVKHGVFSTKLAIYNQLAIAGNYSIESVVPDISGLLFQLGTTDDDLARESLVELIDVYVGEAHSSALLVSVTLHGKKILPMLKKKRMTKPVSQCTPPEKTGKPNNTWCLAEEQVINRLERMIEYIESGKEAEYIW